MSMYYSHLLVPADPRLVFASERVAAFLGAVVEEGFVGAASDRYVKTYPDPEATFFWGIDRDTPKAGRTKGPNPATWLRVDGGEELAEALARDAPNVQATVWSELRPPRAPMIELEALQPAGRLPMTDPQFDEVYYVAITCHRTPVPVCMSDDSHRDDGGDEFGEPVDERAVPPAAVANDPHGLERIEVAGIGAARAWVSVTFGKYVFPPARLFAARRLDLATPDLVTLAQRLLGCPLRQTCAWG